MRSNLHAGGKLARAKITDDMLELAAIVRPKLIQDGMFLVGLDVVGDKLMEINVFSPGGLIFISELEHVNFFETILHAVERTAEAVRQDRLPALLDELLSVHRAWFPDSPLPALWERSNN